MFRNQLRQTLSGPSSRNFSTIVNVMSSRGNDGHAVIAVLGWLGGMRTKGTPWWAIFLLGLMVLAVALVSVVFPQESAHRLAWWRSWWKTWNRRR